MSSSGLNGAVDESDDDDDHVINVWIILDILFLE